MKHSSALILCLAITTCGTAAPATGNDRQVLLDVQPAAAPVPALKYQLLPEVSEMNPGNSVPAYLKCFAEQTNFFFKKESSDERERLLHCPLTDIAPGSLKDYGGSALKQADHAARLEYCDWNILPQMREKGYMLLLPEIQQMRTLASALAVRCRGQLADKDYDGAVGTLKTLFALGRNMGDHPTIISGLVGAAIAQIGLNLIEEFVQQPGAPNLYWALTGLPTPLVDLRRAASAEQTITEASFGSLLDRKRAWTVEDTSLAMQKFKEFASLIELSAEGRAAAEQWMRDRVKDEAWQTATRKSLIEAGYPVDIVGKYPPEQVLVYHLYRKFKINHSDAMKWIPVPYWQAEAAMAELGKPPVEIEDTVTRQFVFAVPKIKAAHLRLEQRIAMLRVVEAIRLDAASNGGKLPSSLTEVTSPLPVDPATGKPFAYKVDGLMAIIDGKPTSISGGLASAASGGAKMKYAYEVRLRK
jgi:hypothetical protein